MLRGNAGRSKALNSAMNSAMILEKLSRFLPNWAKPRMPTRDELAGNRWLAPIAHRFLSPELWRFTRRSVPRGVALGLFCAFIIPVGQIFLAAFMALPARANVPMSAIVTFITNPFTFPFWIVVANRVGAFILKIDAAAGGVANTQLQGERGQLLAQFFETAGVTAFGFVVLAVVSAAVGYLASSWIWRFMVARRRSRRLESMEQALDKRLKASDR